MRALDMFHRSLTAAGRGEAKAADRSIFDPGARAAVRYADPTAWVTATAVGRALLGTKLRISVAGDRTGIVTVSEHGPMETMATVAEAAREGYSSPLRYPAANPASLAGVSCILFRLRGPSLNLLMPLSKGVSAGLFMAGRWLDRRVVEYVVVAACERRSEGAYLSRAVLLTRREPPSDQPTLDRTGDIGWLMGMADREAPA
jgi:hypothetical protein